jgi:hypothetical protein
MEEYMEDRSKEVIKQERKAQSKAFAERRRELATQKRGPAPKTELTKRLESAMQITKLPWEK